MKAKLPAEYISNGKNYGDTKEMIDTWNVAGMINGKIETPITARCYMGRSSSASVIYASIWVHNVGAGHGSAGGGGYHKQSAAIGDAIANAGITLWGSPYQDREGDEDREAHIGGCGSGSIDAALLAIAEALGLTDAVVIHN